MVDQQGRVYIFYPIHQIAEKSQKGTTTVKLALKHLIEIGILKKVQGIALKIMEDDPLLEKEKNTKLNDLVKEKFSSRIEI